MNFSTIKRSTYYRTEWRNFFQQFRKHCDFTSFVVNTPPFGLPEISPLRVKIPRTISSIIYKCVKRKYSCCDALQEIKRYPDGRFSPLTLSSPGVIPIENQS